MKTPLLVFLFSVSLAVSAIAQSKPKITFVPMTAAKQESYLSSVLPKKYNIRPFKAYLLALRDNITNGGTACSGGGIGSAAPIYEGSDIYYLNSYTSTVCRQLFELQSTAALAVPDAGRGGHIFFVACHPHDTWTRGYDACRMQRGPWVNAVLRREKHGRWTVSVRTYLRLGGKITRSDFAVIEIKEYKLNAPHR